MRLLEIEDNGDLRLVEYMDEKEIPPYAILSHRWGADNEEVTLRDILEGTGISKIGYDKIRACGHEATLDGLKLFWVDTYCLNNVDLATTSCKSGGQQSWHCLFIQLAESLDLTVCRVMPRMGPKMGRKFRRIRNAYDTANNSEPSWT
jgi:hypothetical protein